MPILEVAGELSQDLGVGQTVVMSRLAGEQRAHTMHLPGPLKISTNKTLHLPRLVQVHLDRSLVVGSVARLGIERVRSKPGPVANLDAVQSVKKT
ncbi:hypothetical protein QNM99_05670 [Pseudomonas sp. PCH446]